MENVEKWEILTLLPPYMLDRHPESQLLSDWFGFYPKGRRMSPVGHRSHAWVFSILHNNQQGGQCRARFACCRHWHGSHSVPFGEQYNRPLYSPDFYKRSNRSDLPWS